MHVILDGKKRGLGWVPQTPNINDHQYTPPKAIRLPDRVDLSLKKTEDGKHPLLGKPWDQGGIGSCVANAAGKAWHYTLGFENRPHRPNPSRLFIYYNARAYQGWQGSDTGCFVPDAFRGLNQFGAPPERFWPYRTTKFAQEPPRASYDQAEKREAVEYLTVQQDSVSMMTCLAEGFPIVFGFTMYYGFPIDRNHVIKLPKAGQQSIGGHSMLITGYRHFPKYGLLFRVLNSWGDDFEDHGYCWMPEEYLTNSAYSSDFWTLRKIARAA